MITDSLLIEFRKCRVCGVCRDISEFPRKADNADRVDTRCRPCKRDYHREYRKRSDLPSAAARRYKSRNVDAIRMAKLKNRYGIDAEQFDALWAVQSGSCAICQETLENSGVNGVHVDHCHATGVIRGLLCGPCNRGIGSLRDNPDRLRRAAAYIEERSPKVVPA